MAPSQHSKSYKQATIYYDHQCKLCSKSISFLQSIDRKNKLLFRPIESIEAEQELSTIKSKNSQKLNTIYFKYIDSTIYQKSTAVLLSVSSLGGFWKMSKVFLLIPSQIRDKFYDWIASNRYRWFGVCDKCV